MSHIFEDCQNCEETIMCSEVPIQLCEDCFEKAIIKPKEKQNDD